jgi:hypothetical protein
VKTASRSAHKFFVQQCAANVLVIWRNVGNSAATQIIWSIDSRFVLTQTTTMTDCREICLPDCNASFPFLFVVYVVLCMTMIYWRFDSG